MSANQAEFPIATMARVQGSQYKSLAFGGRCREAGVRPSMGSVGDAYDNAMCESFFATLECKLLERCRFASQAEAKMAALTRLRGFADFEGVRALFINALAEKSSLHQMA
jgi:transposase InsO family protein